MKTNVYFSMSAMLLAAAVNSFAQPNFSLQPADQTANQSFNATFRATASGAPPLSYQWFFASNAIAGAITNVLTVTNAQPTNAGAYFTIATDASGSATSRVATLTVNLPAVLNPKIGANIRLGPDPAELPPDQHAQKEPHIARSYSDPNLLVAAFMDGPGAIGCGYAISRDGGLTWKRGLLPGLTTLNGGTYPFAADVVAAVDLEGRCLISSLHTSNSADSRGAVVSVSEAGADTFDAPRQVYQSGPPNRVVDKEWIAINTFRDSPTVGRLAMSFTLEAGSLTSSTDSQTVFTYSGDGGSTWTTPQPVGPINTSGSQNMFLPDGSLAMVYWHFLGGYESDGPNRIEMLLSEDGGDHFGTTNIVASIGTLYLDGYAFNGNFFPSATTDRQAGILYVAYSAKTNGVPVVMFTKSIDKGLTWSKSMRVNDTPSKKSVFNPAIAVSPDGQHVTVIFDDKRDNGGKINLADLYLAESFDGGTTWEPNLRLTEFSTDYSKAPILLGMHSLGEYFGITPALNFSAPGAAVWIDTRSGDPDPYTVLISRTKGATFAAWQQLRFATSLLADVSISGETADADGDGIPNLAEYALGLEPGHPDQSPVSASLGETPASLRVTYERLAVLSDVRFEWQSSENLKDWAAVTPASERIVPGRDPWMERVEADFPGSRDKKFFRLGLRRVQ